MARTNGLVAFLGGLGAGYLKGEGDKKDRERQAKMDQITIDRADRETKAFEQDQKVDEALAKTADMKVGALRDANGQMDTSEKGFAAKMASQGVDAETVASTAPLYAKAAAEPGSKKWLDNSALASGSVKATTDEDVQKARADAFAKGGAKFDANRMAALKDAATAKFSDGVRKIMSFDGSDFTPIKEAYDHFDDGYDIHGESGSDGKFYTFYTDKEGNKLNKQSWESPKDFQQSAIAHLLDPNNTTSTITNMMRYEDKKFEKAMAQKKDTRDEQKTAADLAASGVSLDFNKGELANQKRKQEDAHAESIANRDQSAASAASSRATADKTRREGSGPGVDLTNEKNVDAVMENINAQIGEALTQKKLWSPEEGKTKFTTMSKSMDGNGNEVSTGKVRYKLEPKLEEHAGALIRGGVPSEQIAGILADRKRDSKGKQFYSWMVESKTADGRTVQGYPVKDGTGKVVSIIPIK